MPYMVMPTCKLEDCAHCSAQYKTPACNPLVVHSCFAYRLIHVLIQNISDLFNQFGLGLREEPLKRSLFDRVTLTGDTALKKHDHLDKKIKRNVLTDIQSVWRWSYFSTSWLLCLCYESTQDWSFD